MNSTSQFRINAPTVISETIDGEAIIINLDTGAYYSLRETGAAIWQLIEQGATGQAISAELIQRYDSSLPTIEAGLQSLLDELVQDQLIVPHDGERTMPQSAGSIPTDRHHKLPFTPPTLEKFTDMADLLLLDPIHDVSEQGWPAPKRAG